MMEWLCTIVEVYLSCSEEKVRQEQEREMEKRHGVEHDIDQILMQPLLLCPEEKVRKGKRVLP